VELFLPKFLKNPCGSTRNLSVSQIFFLLFQPLDRLPDLAFLGFDQVVGVDESLESGLLKFDDHALEFPKKGKEVYDLDRTAVFGFNNI